MWGNRSNRAIVGAVLGVILIAVAIWVTVDRKRDLTADARVASSAVGNPSDDSVVETTGVQPDAKAPSSIAVAVRPGVTIDPSLVAPTTQLGQTAVYPDGLRVTVGGISRVKVEAKGPGSINAVLSVFTVTVANGSDQKVDLSRVVATVVYGGARGRLADPSYDVDVQDFTGTVSAGKSETTRYAFNIPDEGLGDVSLHLDLDGRHVPAVFKGAVPQ